MRLLKFLLFCSLISTLSAGSLQRENLRAELESLGREFNGRVGVCVQQNAATACLNGDQRFSMQSVMKLLAGAAVMDAVDHQGWKLDEKILIRRQDLSLYVQPLAELVAKQGSFTTTVDDLVRRAVVDSDSAATDILIAKLGGPTGVQAFLNRHSIRSIRLDRDERHLQTEIVGLSWKPEFVDAKLLDQAIAAVPEVTRDEAYRRYQSDERDTATPRGMAEFLNKLAQGKLLSRAHTGRLIEIMTQTVTFPDRLKAGVSNGWTIAHKTGTSSTWRGVTAATNDVGILTAPDGSRIAVVVFIGDSREPSARKAALMAAVTKAVIAHYR